MTQVTDRKPVEVEGPEDVSDTQQFTLEKRPIKDAELECVKWVIAGKTLEDISTITGMPYRTVRYHLDNLKERYGFSSRLQMLVRVAQDYNLDPLYPKKDRVRSKSMPS